MNCALLKNSSPAGSLINSEKYDGNAALCRSVTPKTADMPGYAG